PLPCPFAHALQPSARPTSPPPSSSQHLAPSARSALPLHGALPILISPAATAQYASKLSRSGPTSHDHRLGSSSARVLVGRWTPAAHGRSDLLPFPLQAEGPSVPAAPNHRLRLPRPRVLGGPGKPRP